jgi:ClpP class serine protease
MKPHDYMPRRLLALAACLEPRAAAGLRAIAARWLKGETVEASELAEALPKMGFGSGGRGAGRDPGGGDGSVSPVSLGIGIDWSTYQPVLKSAYRIFDNGVGLMELSGPFVFGADIFDVLFFGALPQELVAAAYRQAATDPRLKKLAVLMHTPGGHVWGCQEVVAAIGELKAVGKGYVVCVHSMMASLGVMYGCMADEIVVTPTSEVGSIGTSGGVWYDTSELAKEEGVRAIPNATDPRKLRGAFGVPITEDMLDDERRIVRKHATEYFFPLVEKHRKLPKGAAAKLRARMYMGSDIIKAGLADREVASVDAWIKEITGQAPPAPAPEPAGVYPDPDGTPPTPESPEDPEQEPDDMADIKTAKLEDLERDNPTLLSQIRTAAAADAAKPKPATIAELKSAIPGAENAEFRENCLEKNMSLADAKGAYADHLVKANKELEGKLAAAKTEAEKAAGNSAEQERSLGDEGKGTQPVGAAPGGGAGAGGGGGKFSTYQDALDHYVKNEKKTLPEAVKLANTNHPELRSKYAGHDDIRKERAARVASN